MKFKLNHKGQVINSVTATIISLFVAIVTIFAVLYAIAILNPSSFFGPTAGYNGTLAGNVSQDAMRSLEANSTRIVGNFSQFLPVVGTIFGVILILAVIAILILYVLRFRGSGSQGSL